jgi:hypothetical protein
MPDLGAVPLAAGEFIDVSCDVSAPRVTRRIPGI